MQNILLIRSKLYYSCNAKVWGFEKTVLSPLEIINPNKIIKEKVIEVVDLGNIQGTAFDFTIYHSLYNFCRGLNLFIDTLCDSA